MNVSGLVVVSSDTHDIRDPIGYDIRDPIGYVKPQ